MAGLTTHGQIPLPCKLRSGQYSNAKSFVEEDLKDTS